MHRSRLAFVAAGFCGALVGCGGGGGGASAPAPAPSPPAALPAVLSVPAPVGYDVARQAVFDHLNAVRLAAGLGLVAQDVRLDAAAQAHAGWEIANDLYQHDELAGTPAFTGVDVLARETFAGYPAGSGAEVMTAGYGPAAAVDLLVNVAYHRQTMLAFYPLDVGIGWSADASAHVERPLVVELAKPNDGSGRSHGQTAQAATGGVLVWPADGAQGVFTLMGAETPDPVPAVDSHLLGTPASVSVDYWRRIATTSFTLREAATGAVVPTALLDERHDPNALLYGSYVALVPLQALHRDTVYRVDFAGTISTPPDPAAVDCVRSWTFTTGSVDAPPAGP